MDIDSGAGGGMLLFFAMASATFDPGKLENIYFVYIYMYTKGPPVCQFFFCGDEPMSSFVSQLSMFRLKVSFACKSSFFSPFSSLSYRHHITAAFDNGNPEQDEN